MKIKQISREEEANLPKFNNHDEARKYFKDLYGDMFQMKDSEIIDGRKIYFYHLILDHDAFMKGIKEMNDQGFSSGFDFLRSHQNVEILEDGGIHIIH